MVTFVFFPRIKGLKISNSYFLFDPFWCYIRPARPEELRHQAARDATLD